MAQAQRQSKDIPSGRIRRRPGHGVTLLETLVAFAILAMVVTASLSVFASSATRQTGRLQALHAAEFALSLAEEYRRAAPAMSAQGQAPNGWSWRISEAQVAPDGPTALSPLMDLIALDITIYHASRAADLHRFSTIVARRRP